MSTPDPQQAEGLKEKTERNVRQTNYRILIVDDDHFLLDMYCLKFSQAGFAIQPCKSAKEAITALRGGFKADAVVFDLVMPEQDGFELMKIIRDEHLADDAALIALTNQGEDEEKQKVNELGGDGYIVKASSIPSEVVTTVVDIIKKKRGV